MHFKRLLEKEPKPGPLSREDGPTPGTSLVPLRRPYLSVARHPEPTRPRGHRARPIPVLPHLTASGSALLGLGALQTLPQTRVAGPLPHPRVTTHTPRPQLLTLLGTPSRTTARPAKIPTWLHPPA